MHDMAVLGRQFRPRHVPVKRGGLEQHGFCGRAGDAHRLLAGHRHRRAAAGDLQAHELRRLEEEAIDGIDEESREVHIAGGITFGERVIGILGSRGSLDHRHAVPVGIHLLGEHHGQRRMRALAHLGMRNDCRYRIVG